MARFRQVAAGDMKLEGASFGQDLPWKLKAFEILEISGAAPRGKLEI